MKISYVLDTIHPYSKGGRETRLFNITTRLAQEGHEIHIYTMKWWNGENDIIENNLHLHAICPLYPVYKNGKRSIKQGIMFGIHCLKLLNTSWDILDVDHMPYFPLLACKVVCLVKRKKLFATWHEVWGKEYWTKYLGPSGIIAYVLEILTLQLPDKIISNSDLTTKRLRKMGCKKEIVTIPLGIDYEVIQKVKPSNETSDIIYVGRLLKHKNLEYLVNAVSLLTKTQGNIKCIIVGSGPELNNLVQLVKTLKLQDNIIFKEHVENHEDVFSLMKSSKVFVLPSTREGFGIVVIEANACGIPVITIDHEENAARLLIEHGKNGFLTALEPDLIAETAHNFLKDYKNSKVESLGEINNHNWKSIIDSILISYELKS